MALVSTAVSVCVRLGVYSGPQRSGRYEGVCSEESPSCPSAWPFLSGADTTHHKTLSNAAWIPHPVRPLNGYDPINAHRYLECVRDLVCAF